MRKLLFPDWLKRLLTTPTAELSRWQYALRFLAELCRHGAIRLRQDRANQMAAALAFRTIFGLIPLMIIVMLLFRGFGGTEIFAEFVDDMLTAASLNEIGAPGGATNLGEWARQRIGAISAQLSARTIGIIGGVVLVWAAIGLLSTIERCFNAVCQAQENRPLYRRIPLYWTTVTLGPALLYLSFHFQGRFVDMMLSHGVSDGSAAIVGTLSGFVATWLMLLVMYALLPNTRVSLRAAVGGSFLAAVLWTMLTRAFAAYVSWSFSVESSAFTILYGTLGLIPLFLLWIYLLWLIVIYGLEITNMLQVVGIHMDRPVPVKTELPPLTDPAVIIPVMQLVAMRFSEGDTTSSDAVCDELGLNKRTVETMFGGLVDAGILHNVSMTDESRFAPARPTETISTAELLDVAVKLTLLSNTSNDTRWAWVRSFHAAISKLPIHKPISQV
ncbi:MAG: YihY/virulence factor BrkB family protein [Planctomycetota bacterium]|jgi:membrane protein